MTRAASVRPAARHDEPEVPLLGEPQLASGEEPAQDVLAEQAVLGSMMLSPEVLGEVLEVVEAGDFYQPRHEVIYGCIVGLYGSGRPVDALTVGAELARSGQAGRAGGAVYLHTLISSVPTAANAGHYAAIVAEQARLRRLEEAGLRIVARVRQAVEGSGGGAHEIREAARGEIEATSGRVADPLNPLGEYLGAFVEALGTARTPVYTPWPEWDDLTGGLVAGRTYVFAGRPGDGKSIVGAQLAKHVADSGAAAFVASVEMPRDDYLSRVLAHTASVDLTYLQPGRKYIPPEVYDALAKAEVSMIDLPLYVDDRPAQTVADIAARSRWLARSRPLGLIVVDYLQRVGVPAHLRRERRDVVVGSIARDFADLAKELHVPLVLLVQVNRDPIRRGDRPRMSDLRESGDIETHADVVTLLWRDVDEAPAAVRMVVDKSRHGRTGIAAMRFLGHLSRISPYPSEDDPYPDAP